MSQRTARLDELLREEISAVLRREVDDPRIGFVTVTRVEVTPDLSHAIVWVSLIGRAEERKETLRGLQHAMPFVRRQLRGLRLKRIPELHARLDDTAEKGTRLLHLLNELAEGREPSPAPVEETLPSPLPRPEPVVEADGSPAAPRRARRARGIRPDAGRGERRPRPRR
ncbi:MAG TPA: 30S ribosome-binding factor RbfA [Candidatus Limnocylindrales bacterium]|nr:30S ribosome-binding factor RbfA [Candidatus Limnocylindrales bacterium]